MTNNICPACGSGHIIKSEEKKLISLPYSDEEYITIVNYKCNTCLTEGDFFGENDEKINVVIIRQRKRAVINILNYFVEAGVSLSTMERILDLPQRTLTVWMEGDLIPAAGVTLLRMIRTVPELLEVAENKYEKI